MYIPTAIIVLLLIYYFSKKEELQSKVDSLENDLDELRSDTAGNRSERWLDDAYIESQATSNSDLEIARLKNYGSFFEEQKKREEEKLQGRMNDDAESIVITCGKCQKQHRIKRGLGQQVDTCANCGKQSIISS